MWTYILRRTLYNIPVFLAIIFLMMAALRVSDPVMAQLGKQPTEADIAAKKVELGLDKPLVVQYGVFLGKMVRLDFSEQSWDQKRSVGDMISGAIPPSMALTIPTLTITATIAICIGLISAFFRGRVIDKTLMLFAVTGMSISVLVYIMIGQYWGAFLPSQYTEGWPFQVTVTATAGGSPWFFFVPKNWVAYCMLPVMINVVVALGYDTRFYRAVMVEESQRDYIRTARAKGASTKRVMFVHMLKNAMIPIITRIMISLPFIVTGSILIEMYFGIPGMGRTLIQAITNKDFPVIQAFTALFAAMFIASNILTDVLYALADPRVRLS